MTFTKSDKCIFLDYRLYNSIRLEFCRVVKHLNKKPSEASVNVWQKPLLRVRNTDDIKKMETSDKKQYHTKI